MLQVVSAVNAEHAVKIFSSYNEEPSYHAWLEIRNYSKEK